MLDGSLFTGLSVDWMEGYGNSPQFRLEGPGTDYNVTREIYRDGNMIWEEIGPGCFFTSHPSGIVRYLHHSGGDRNEGGFGGAHYHLKMVDGTERILKGPWSSRASVMNQFLPENELIVDTRGPTIRLSTLLSLAKTTNFPYFIIQPVYCMREEPEPIRPSTAPNMIQKPSGQIDHMHRTCEFKVHYQPKV